MITFLILFSFTTYFWISSHYSAAQLTIQNTAEITPTDDAYVTTDRYDPQDIQGFQKINTGNLTHLKVWYAWNVTSTSKQFIMSLVYLKFDLTNVTSQNITSATLNLYPYVISLTSPSRQVDVCTASNSNWNESSIVYDNAPPVSLTQCSASILDSSKLNTYVTWNVTGAVRSYAGSFLTLVLFYDKSYLHSQEFIDFYSKEYSDPLKRPTLELGILPQNQLVVQPSPSSSGENNNTIFDSRYGYVISGIIGAAIGIGAFAVIKRRKKDSSSTLSTTTSGDARMDSVKAADTVKLKNTVRPSGTVKTPVNVPCPSCKKQISTDFKLCPHCGLGLDRYIRCPYCGRLSLSSLKFCTNCGKDMY